MGRLVFGLSSPQECCKDKMPWTKRALGKEELNKYEIAVPKDSWCVFSGKGWMIPQRPRTISLPGHLGRVTSTTQKVCKLFHRQVGPDGRGNGPPEEVGFSPLQGHRSKMQLELGEPWVLVNLSGTYPGTYCKLPPSLTCFSIYKRCRCLLSPLHRGVTGLWENTSPNPKELTLEITHSECLIPAPLSPLKNNI